MITVSQRSYEAIEDALEQHWHRLPWKRMFVNGERGTYQEVIDRFDLVCTTVDDDKVNVALVSKEDNCCIPFDQTFERYM